MKSTMTTSVVQCGILLCIFCFISSSNGQCTFPTELRGTWNTGQRGNITITNEYIFNFVLNAVGAKTFRCQEMYGDRYVVKTTNTFSYIDPTLIFSALICFDFKHISTDFYYFYMGSNTSIPERVYFNLNDLPVDAATVCAVNPTDYVVQAYDVMIRDGNIEGSKLPCPTALQKYWAYNFNQGSGNLCTSDRTMDVCTDTEVTFNYTKCNAVVAYSDSGRLNCLHNVTSGSTTYVTLYNNDSTVDDSTTYRFSCLAFSSSGSDMFMTQNPKVCSEFQNSTSVDMAVGAQLFLFNGTACYITTPPDLTWLYITLGVVFGLFFIIAIVVFLYFFSKYKAKQKPFRGGLEPANLSPRVPGLMNGHGITFKPSPGIPENDAPVNVMKLLRKELATPAGRDSPTSNFNVTINTPPQLFNIREIDSCAPSPSRESPNHKKDYHVLGGADQSEYGDLTLDDEKTSHTPVMVLPVKKSRFSVEEMEDDYDDDDDDLLTTPGRSRLVAATQGMYGSDPMCPATRLPGITEDVALTNSDMFRVGGGRPLGNSGTSNITFLNEHGMPLPPITPPPIDAVETVRDSNSKLRVKSKRRASLTKDSRQAEIIRGEMETPRDDRGPREPERGDDPDKVEMVFTVIKQNKKLETGIGPVSARSGSFKRGGKPNGALLRSRSAILDNRRGQAENKHDAKMYVREDDDVVGNAKTITTVTNNNTTNNNNNIQAEAKAHRKDNTVKKETPKKRPKSVCGPRDAAAKEALSESRLSGHTTSFADAEETPSRPTSSLRLTRVDIPDLTPPVPGNKAPPKPASNECVDTPGRRRSIKHEEDVVETKPNKMWLDPVRPGANVWGQMSNVWKDGQAWSHRK